MDSWDYYRMAGRKPNSKSRSIAFTFIVQVGSLDDWSCLVRASVADRLHIISAARTRMVSSRVVWPVMAR